MWILISWLPQKPADLDLHYFHTMINMDSAGQGLKCISESDKAPVGFTDLS